MLKRIRIQGYKSLRDVEVELEPLSVLFGPNAAGKSNFLDALQLLSRMGTSRTLKEAFEPPYRGKPLESFAFDNGGLEQLLEQEKATFSIEVDVELAPTVVETVERQIRETRAATSEIPSEAKHGGHVREPNLRYRIEVEIRPKSGLLRVADEYLAALNGRGEVSGKRKPFLEKIKQRFHLRMEGQAHPTYHERFLDHTILSRPVYPPHYPHLVAMREELSRYFFYYFEPRERMRAPCSVKEVRHIGLMGEELSAFLNTLKTADPRQYRAVEKSLSMIVPSISGIEVEVNRFGEVDLWLREGEMRVPARVISEGTLRILGLLALSGVHEPPALLGFEEPENGVHPRRVQMIAELLRTRSRTGQSQLIATTHSPILADLLPNRSLFVCRKTDGRTDISPLDTWGLLGRRRDIGEALDEHSESGGTFEPSLAMMRGDFDA